MSISARAGAIAGVDPAHASPSRAPKPGDFTTDSRVLLLMGIAVLVATSAVAAAWVLLKLISLCTNVAYYGRFTTEPLPISATPLGWYAVFVPVVGCLIIGLMARFGSEKIRGHGHSRGDRGDPDRQEPH